MKLIDSSVIIKFFSKEPGWESAKEHLTYESATVDLAVKELGNALWKKVRRGEMRLDDAIEILTSYPLAVNILDQKKYLSKALEIAAAHDITLYDSLFVAAAIENGCELVTCDKKQMLLAAKLGVKAALLKEDK